MPKACTGEYEITKFEG